MGTGNRSRGITPQRSRGSLSRTDGPGNRLCDKRTDPSTPPPQVTPDLTPLVHEVLSQPGLTLPVNMVFIFERVSGNGLRTFNTGETLTSDESGKPLLCFYLLRIR